MGACLPSESVWQGFHVSLMWATLLYLVCLSLLTFPFLVSVCLACMGLSVPDSMPLVIVSLLSSSYLSSLHLYIPESER